MFVIKGEIYLDQTDLAQALGMSYASVSNTIRGKPALRVSVKNPEDGRVKGVSLNDFTTWVQNREADKYGSQDTKALDRHQENARKERALAERTEMQNQITRGQLVDVSQIEAAGIDMVLRTKARLLNVPSSVAAIVVGEEDQVVVQTLIKDAITDALTELSVEWMAKDEDEDQRTT